MLGLDHPYTWLVSFLLLLRVISLSLPSSSTGDGSSSVVLMMKKKKSSSRKNLIDMNQVPTEGDEDWLMMSADTTTSINDAEDEDRSIISAAAAAAGVGPPRKKLRLSNDQSRLLEDSFRLNHTLNPKQKEVLAMHLKLKPRQIEVWFQNRRARSKLKQTELEYQHLKRWFGSLTEQNRRLQKEVEELRSLRLGPRDVLISPSNNEPLPAVSAQTVCPRCERVSTPAFSIADKGPSRMPPADAAPAATVSFKPPPDPQRHLRQPSAASS